MSSKWDSTGIAFQPATWAALSEHLLPGAFIFVFGSSRGWHRLAVAIEDAGFVFHPSLMVWGALQGQGFPKATRIKAKDWEETETQRIRRGDKRSYNTKGGSVFIGDKTGQVKKPTTDLARAWEGHRYGRQALKPAVEMVICAQKPYGGKPVDSIVETGAGSLWIDGGRVQSVVLDSERRTSVPGAGIWGHGKKPSHKEGEQRHNASGRWPPNFVLLHSPPHICADCDGDGCSECNDTGLVGGCQRAGTKRVKPQGGSGRASPKGAVTGMFPVGNRDYEGGFVDSDGCEEVAAWACTENCAARRIGEQSGEMQTHSVGRALARKQYKKPSPSGYGGYKDYVYRSDFTDKGTAARFFPQFDWAAEVAERLANSGQVFYASKASRGEREAGLDGLPLHGPNEVYGNGMNTATKCDPELHTPEGVSKRPKRRNNHPTVKAISLCRWLATLLLPPPEYAPRRILIPFSGVSSEGIGAFFAGFDEIVMIEQDAEYCTIGEARLKFWSQFNSYEEAMEATQNIQRSHRKQDAQAQSGQLKMTL